MRNVLNHCEQKKRTYKLTFKKEVKAVSTSNKIPPHPPRKMVMPKNLVNAPTEDPLFLKNSQGIKVL